MASKALAIRRVSPARRRSYYSSRLNSGLIRRVGKRAKHITIPIAVFGGFIPLAMNLKDGYNVKGLSGIADRLPGIAGFETDGHFAGWSVMQNRGVGAILGGLAVHWVANKTGINRLLSRSRVPLIRI